MFDIKVEIIGIIASLLVLASLTFKSTSVKLNILMRALNGLGGAAFVAYGAVIIANGGFGWSLVVCNGLLVIFDCYHIVKMYLSIKKLPLEVQSVQSSEELSPKAETEQNNMEE